MCTCSKQCTAHDVAPVNCRCPAPRSHYTLLGPAARLMRVCLQCAGIAKAEPGSQETLAWTCGLSSGAITGLVTVMDQPEAFEGTAASAPAPASSEAGLLFEFSFFRPLSEPSGATHCLLWWPMGVREAAPALASRSLAWPHALLVADCAHACTAACMRCCAARLKGCMPPDEGVWTLMQ